MSHKLLLDLLIAARELDIKGVTDRSRIAAFGTATADARACGLDDGRSSGGPDVTPPGPAGRVPPHRPGSPAERAG